MAITIGKIVSPCVAWKTALPHPGARCQSPRTSLCGGELYITIEGSWSGGEEEWHFTIKCSKSSDEYWVTVFVMDDNEKYRSLFTMKIPRAYSQELKRSTLRTKCLCNGDDISLLIVFNCSSRSAADKDIVSAATLCFKKFSEDIVKLLENKERADVTLKCGDRSFSAHKTILSARSDVFSAMFRNDMSESNSGEVDIVDMDPSILEQFLLFIYSSKTDFLSMDTVEDFYVTAEKYAVYSLKQKCTSFMLENLSKENVCQVLQFAHKFADSKLSDGAASFVLENRELLKMTEWREFAKENPNLDIDVYLQVFE